MASAKFLQAHTWQAWQREVEQALRSWLPSLLLYHYRAIGWGILMVSILITIWGVIGVIYFPPSAPLSEAPAAVPNLSQATIDQLEFWIEDVEDERRDELRLPAQPVFFVPTQAPSANP